MHCETGGGSRVKVKLTTSDCFVGLMGVLYVFLLCL